MPLYKHVTSDERAVPDRLAELNRHLSDMGSATSGQINSTVRKLEAAIAVIPVVVSTQSRRDNIPGFSSGEVTFATTTLTVPPEKTVGSILAFASGMMSIDGASSEGAGAYIYIGDTRTQVAHSWAQNRDYAIIGNATRQFTVSPAQRITVRLTCTATTRPITGSSNWGAINAVGIFSS